MKILMILCFFFLTSTFLVAQSPVKSDYKIRGKGRLLVVTYRAKPHMLDLGEKIGAAKITDTAVVFAERRGRFTYLVIDVIGQSKLKEDARQCGAGIESNLIWLKLDAAWKVADSNSVRYESCWSPTTSDDGYRTKGHVLILEIDDFHDDLHTMLTYDANQPEKGFMIKKTPLKSR